MTRWKPTKIMRGTYNPIWYFNWHTYKRLPKGASKAENLRAFLKAPKEEHNAAQLCGFGYILFCERGND